MIIVQLKGGLGNQLFQYAAGLSLGRHHQVPVKVDISELRHADEEIGTVRNFELQHLIAPPQIATQREIHQLVDKNLLIKYFQKTLPSFRRTVYNEKQFTFDPNFFKAGKNIYLKGYRQSEKYFGPVAADLRAAFKFKSVLIAAVENNASTIKAAESVAIHVRRGDYNNKALTQYHGIISETYYQQSINRIESIIAAPQFYVFSDDIDWVRKNLKFGKPVEFVSGALSKNHYQDFHLMQSCKHQIIANSSFSWWAAWLNPNPGKIVIAPTKWFNHSYDTSDLIPQSWSRL